MGGEGQTGSTKYLVIEGGVIVKRQSTHECVQRDQVMLIADELQA